MKQGLNLGCGRMIMPRERPDHHELIPLDVYEDTDTAWTNVDMHALPGVDRVFDLFRYPWPLEDQTYDVVLAAHLVEHIPHGIIRHGQLESLHGGWFAWWNELGRVMRPGGIIYVLCPFAWGAPAVMDPTHTRYMVFESFGYLKPNPEAPFEYPVDYTWEMVYPGINFVTESVQQAQAMVRDSKDARVILYHRMNHELNIVSEICLGLQVQPLTNGESSTE